MNKRGEENRSVRNTKKRLREGLLELLQEKPLNKISVRELAERVDVNRGTFYFHYKDIYDMVREMEDQFFQDFQAVLDLPESQKKDFLPMCFQCIYSHMDLCRLLLGENGDIAFVEKMKKLVGDKCSVLWKSQVSSIREEEVSILNSFLIGGVVEAIHAWLKTCPDYSTEELSEFLTELIYGSISPVLFQQKNSDETASQNG